MSKVYQANIGDAIPIVQTSAQRDAMRGNLGAALTRVHNLQTNAIERWDGQNWIQDIPLPAASSSSVAASVLDGTAVVADQAARTARFPSPATNNRVQRLDTGYFERYNGSAWVPEGKTRAAGPEISMVALGADPTGVSDCSAFATAAKALAATSGGIIDFDPGTYLFTVDTDFTGYTHRHAPTAVIKRSATATVTLGRIIAGDYKILDDSAVGTGQFLLAFGAKQTDTFNARWAGVKADGTDDSAAMNLLADLCWGKAGVGLTRYGFNNAKKNRPVLLPAGFISLQSAPWNISGTAGAKIIGAGRLATTISVDTANMIGLIADSVAYPRFQDIIFAATQTQDVDHPIIDADYTGAYPTANGYLKPQQWTIDSCYFNGNNKAAIGLHFCRLGPGGPPNGASQAQGDTVLVPNTFFGQFTQAGIRLGAPTNGAGNVLDWHFHGGDWSGCLKYGIESYGGAYHVHGTGQQNQAGFPGDQGGHIPYQDGSNTPLGGRTGATHCGNYPQIDNMGCDFFMTQTSSRGSVRNVRSEGYCLTRGGGISVVDSCETWAGGIDGSAWAATSTNFVQGQLIKSLVPSVTLDGRAWACWTATPTPIATGGSEPAWASARDGFMQENVSVTSGSAVVPCNAPIRVVDKGTLPGIGGNEWGAIVVDPAGTHQKFFAKVLSHVQNVSVTLDANVPWTGSAIIRIGELVTDGSLQWIPYDFLAMQGEFKAITSGQYNFGQVQAKVVPPQIVTATFSRRDWLYDPWAGVPPFTGGALIPYPGMWAEHVGGGYGNVTWPPTPRSLIDPALLLRTYALKGAFKWLAPHLFVRAFGTTPAGDVGIGGLDGAYALKNTRTDLTRNAVGIIGGACAPEPVGFPDNVMTPPANTAGVDRVINGGTSTGTAKSGRVVFATNPGGSAGSSVNDNVESAVVDGDATAGNTRFLLYDVTKATLSRVSVGAADSGGTGFKVLRIPN